jgi:membrane-associated PAP2 superfamily phosphatase
MVSESLSSKGTRGMLLLRAHECQQHLAGADDATSSTHSAAVLCAPPRCFRSHHACFVFCSSCSFFLLQARCP